MAITKNFIQLTPDSGDSYVAEIKLPSKTEFTAYVIDGSFKTSMSTPSMSGSDFEEMKNLAFTQEFKDKSTPLFYFSQSKTFCINMVPAYLAACYSSPSTAIGLFQPTVVELHKTKGSSVVGELVYEGNPIYLSLPSMTRGSASVSTHIKNGATLIAKCSDYNYDIDSKTATQYVYIPEEGWCLGEKDVGRDPIKLHVTSEYVFKYSTNPDKLSTLSFNSLATDDSETAARVTDSLDRGSIGCASKSLSALPYMPILSSKLNIPNSALQSGGSPSFIVSRVLTPQVISSTKASHLCQTINPYGLGEIFTVDTSTSTIKSAGSSYTAVGVCKIIYNGGIRPGSYSLGIRVVANKESISAKTSIIKNSHGYGTTISSAEPTCYKIAVASSYYVLKSGADNPQDDQSYIYCFQEAAEKLFHVGYLQCVTDKNNQALSDSYTTGVMMLGLDLSTGVRYDTTTFSGKIYVLYDDNSVAISSYNVTFSISSSNGTSNSVCPMKISADGKNIVAHRPYLTKSYAGAPAIVDSTFTIGVANGLPADDAFIVPENSGTKKIEAVGVVYDSKPVAFSGRYPYQDLKDGTFLILEPKV